MKNKAFSLTELMIAVVIIGILVSIALPAYRRAVERGRIGWARSALAALRDAELSYFGARESYTNNVAAIASFNGISNPDLDPDWGFAITVYGTGNNYGFTVSARRKRGFYINRFLTLDDKNNPGGNHPAQ